MIVPLYDAVPAIGTGDDNSDQSISAYQWIVAWVLVIILAAAACQTRIGYAVVYYALVLILVLLLVTQYQFIATALAPIGKPISSNS